MVRIKSMPPDGDCLFWALGYFYDVSGPELRRMIINYMKKNIDIKINGTLFKDWIQWGEGISYEQYIKRLEKGLWGGGIEMSLFNAITGSAISVWQVQSRHGKRVLKRISKFEGDDKPHCHIVYINSNHYGVLI